MIVSYNGRDKESYVIGTVIYEPFLQSYSVIEDIGQMIYYNPKDVKYYFKIYYNLKYGFYRAEKFEFEKRIAMAIGSDWRKFFFHVGMISLSQGERCELKVEKYKIPIKPGLN